MLQGKYFGQHRKGGAMILKYRVTGPVAEINKYNEVVSARVQRPIDELPKTNDDRKDPIYFLREDIVLAEGNAPSSSITLELNFGGTQFIRVKSAVEQQQEWARLQEATFNAQAKILAERRLGVSAAVVARGATSMQLQSVNTGTAANVGANAPANQDALIEEMANHGADQPLPEPQGTLAGQE